MVESDTQRHTLFCLLEFLQRNASLPPSEQPLDALRVETEDGFTVPLRILVSGAPALNRNSRRQTDQKAHARTCLISSTRLRG